MNVNVSYNGFSLADAASCVMMRLPVPDLVWDMEALWKVWNEPIPAITPEAVPEPAPEPVRRRGGERFAAKPVTYAGKEYPSIAALAKAYGLGYKTCFARLRAGTPLETPINTHPLPYRGKPVTIDGKEYCSVKDASKALGIPYTTLFTRIRKGQNLSAPWGKGGCKRRKDELEKPAVPASTATAPEPDNTAAVRQAATALPPKSNRYADEGNGRRLRDCPCELDGRQYTSLDTAAVILDLTLGEAYRQVMERGKFLKGRVKE